ncbi:hypothetical protein LC612_42995 [Nostoc sp. CHAB 5834]|nr:hypothetical protein [Nostoc sp. CHAB 5834]
MNQLIHWLRQHWIELAHFSSATDNSVRLPKNENESDNFSHESRERPLNKVYYSTPGGGTRWAYIDKGRIVNTKTTVVKVKIK